MKKAVGVALGILAFVIAGASVYGIFSLNETIQAKPNQIQVSNYSAQIGSLQPQINSISNNVSSLNTLKGDITDIRGKLSDLESKISQAQQPPLASVKPVVVLGRSIYLQGDSAYISAAGLDPQEAVQIQLLDNNGFVVIQEQSRSDSAGRLTLSLPLPSTVAPGNFLIKIISGQQTALQPIVIVSSTQSSGSVLLTGSYPFFAQTDQTVYLPSGTIKVTGTGVPNTTITGTLTGPSERTYTSNTTIRADGTFAIFYSDPRTFDTGYWHVTLNSQGLTKVLYLRIIPPIISSSGSWYPFTAQTSSSIYQAGDQITVSGSGAPYTTVNSVLTSPSGITYTSTTTTRSDGSYRLSYFTSQSSELGYWTVNLANQGQTKQVFIYLGEPGSTSSGSSSTTFTAQTDRIIYKQGDQITISGTGKPYTAVKATLTSPSGITYDNAVTAHLDGSYVLSFTTSPVYETGNWYISITNWSLTKIISIYLEPMN
ncbi:MAG TPA: hypothetical protein VEU72_00825 [Nitrosopumilaceae archaeon]|nr:hypothetical protein [Nitrosopumilaceae archaeon]